MRAGVEKYWVTSSDFTVTRRTHLVKHWEGVFDKDEFRSTVVKETKYVKETKKNYSVGRVLVFVFCVILQGQRSGTQSLCSPFASRGCVCRRRYLDIGGAAGSAGVSTARFAMYQTHSLQSKTKADEVRSRSHEPFKKKQQTQSPL